MIMNFAQSVIATTARLVPFLNFLGFCPFFFLFPRNVIQIRHTYIEVSVSMLQETSYSSPTLFPPLSSPLKSL